MQTRHFLAGALVIAAAVASTQPAAPEARPAAAAAKPPPPVLRAFPVPTPYEEPDLSIPGGGRILIPVGGVRVIRADGTLEYLWTDAMDAVWDPRRPDTPLVLLDKPPGPVLRAYRRTATGWVKGRRWQVQASYWNFSEVSPDGRLIAHSVFSKTGEITGTVNVVDRMSASRWELSTDGLHPVSWTPDGAVLLSDGHERGLFAWDLGSGTVTRLPIDSTTAAALPHGARSPRFDADSMSWSADGRYLASRVSWIADKRGRRNGIAVFSASGEIVDLVSTGKRWPSIPTWSPKRPEIAFVTETLSTDARPRLYLYDAVTGRRTLLMRDSPEPWWVAWSPRGDWMLLDDGLSGSWLFVSRDGTRTVEHARLGSQPRWASPGPDIHPLYC